MFGYESSGAETCSHQIPKLVCRCMISGEMACDHNNIRENIWVGKNVVEVAPQGLVIDFIFEAFK